MSQDLATSEYRKRFGAEPQWISHAPGRINLIGEHTDYTGGFVLPVAIQLGITVAASPTGGATQLFSVQTGEGQSFDARQIALGSVSGWAKYPAGMAWAMEGATNLNSVVVSDLPMASGVSSSAALEVAFGKLYNAIDQRGLSSKDIALLGQRAENEFVGVRCGIMDQMASACGVAGHALLIDTRSLTIAPILIPSNLRVVLCETGSPRELATSAYNTRRAELEEAEQILGKSLRDCTLEDLPIAKEAGTKGWILRAKHVISENLRTQACCKSLQEGNRNLVFSLMKQSHESMKNDFEASSVSQDAMVEAAWESPGVWGARLTGGGFGGACVALVEVDKISEFCMTTEQMFRSLVKGHRPKFVVCTPSIGASVIELDVV